MVFTRLPGITCWSNTYLSLPGACGLSSYHGGGLRAPFLLGCGVAGMADHTMQRVRISFFFPRPLPRNVPAKPRFFVRPQLLTRLCPLPAGKGELLALPSCVNTLEESHFQMVGSVSA